MIDIYDTFFILYKNNEIVGYCYTSIEAEDICKKCHEYSWDYNKQYKSKEEIDKFMQKYPKICFCLNSKKIIYNSI